MQTTIEAIKADIAAALGYDPKNPPVQIDDKQASLALGVKASTLAVWRSAGRYNLPFMKIGRLARYRVSDLAEFLARRTSITPARASEMKKATLDFSKSSPSQARRSPRVLAA